MPRISGISARSSLLAKIEFMEAVVAGTETVPEHPKISKVGDVRDWADASRNFHPWVSHSVLAPNGLFPDLRRRLDEILPLFSRLQTAGSASPSASRRGRAISHKVIRQERDRLAAQVEELLASLHTLERKLRIAEKREARMKSSFVAKIDSLTKLLYAE
jgi:hypothetical protein